MTRTWSFLLLSKTGRLKKSFCLSLGKKTLKWIVLPAIVEEYNEVLYGSHIKKWMFCQYRLLKLGGF